MADIQAVAKAAADWFEYRTRDGDGSRFLILKDGRPDWLAEAVQGAHGDMLPDDRIYSLCRDAVGAIAEGADNDDGAAEFAENAIDPYNHARLLWAASHLDRLELAEVSAEANGYQGTSVVDILAFGQAAEAGVVFEAMWDALEAQAE